MGKTFAFCLFKYFPHGGLQRDMLRIALACRARGHAVEVYTTDWQGDLPTGLALHVQCVPGLTNHARLREYHRWLTEQLARNPADCVIGFNKMPGLDIYYAADGCFKARALERHGRLYRWTPRYRQYQAFEEAVFAKDSKTHILMLSKIQEALYRRHYGTPAARIHFLPPNVTRDRLAGPDAGDIRRAFRAAVGAKEADRLVLQLGSGFRTKGLDRSIRALACLPAALRAKTRLFVVGNDRKQRYVRLARRLDVAKRVEFLGPRDDVPRILLGADLLVHPAYHENTGTVLLEALAAGLPVIASSACGYAHYVEQAQAGWVLPEPFSQRRFDETLRDALARADLRELGRRGTDFARRQDLYGMVDAAVDVIDAVASGQAKGRTVA